MLRKTVCVLLFMVLFNLPSFATLPKVAIVTTGGTIVMKTDPKTGGAVPAMSGDELEKSVPGIGKLADIVVIEVTNIDSSQMTPAIWSTLSRKVDEILAKPDIVGAVVTHGTDTMPEGAYFLNLTLKSNKPVVFTGAMNDASSHNPDGPENIYNAVVQVLSPNAKNWGVTVTLDSYINGARAVRKTQTTNVQTFESGEQGYLGYVYAGKVTRFNDRPRRIRLPLPADTTKSLPKVPFIYTYAGADGSFVRYAVDSGAQGLVVEGVGAGNVNADVYKAIQYALGKNIPVVISSRVYYGAVEPVYGDIGGGKTLENAGCILAGDLMGTKARLLLMLGIARYGNDTAELRKLFSN